jgi:ferredoxin-NADP reductase
MLPGATLHQWYQDLGTREAAPGLSAGLIDLAQVDFPADADVYLCGPLPFMARVRRGALEHGVPAERIHFEVFGPARDLETTRGPSDRSFTGASPHPGQRQWSGRSRRHPFILMI